MEDFEAYGQLRDRPRQAQSVPAGPALPQVQAPPRRKRSHWLRNLLLVVVAYFALAVGTTVQPLPIPFTSVLASVPFPGGAPMLFGLPNRPFVVMVVGLDRRPTETGPSRTDSIILVRIDPGAHKASFLSIPRDSMMQVPQGDGTYTQDRINTAYVYNWSSKDSTAAPKATMATIQHNLGIHVDHYVVFDQRSAEGLIQAMGGVTIDNPRAFGQADYSDDDVHVVPQLFPKGVIHLDGYQAVAYGRIRQGSSDLDRIQRQQRVGSALIHQAESPLSIIHLPAAYNAYQKTVTTDMGLRQSAGVLSMLKGVDSANLKTYSLGDATVPCNSCTGALLLLVPAKVQPIVSAAFNDPAAGATAAQLLTAAGVTP